MYLGRVIKAHNLLQALTRVNRTYKEFQYGYVVDFSDIEKKFEKETGIILMNCNLSLVMRWNHMQICLNQMKK